MKVLPDLCPWPTFDHYARPFWCSLLIKRLMSLWICRNKHWKDGKKQVFNFVYLQKNVLLTGYSLPWRLDIPTNKSWIGREHSVHDISQAISHVTFGSSKTVRRLCSCCRQVVLPLNNWLSAVFAVCGCGRGPYIFTVTSICFGFEPPILVLET